MKDQAAFPYVVEDTPNDYFVVKGLTKREYFAGLAMQSYITGSLSQGDKPTFEDIYYYSIKIADGILNELGEEND